MGLCYRNPPSWAKSCPGESRGGERRARRDGFLMPDSCCLCERSYTAASLASPESSPETSRHRPPPLSQYPQQRPVPPHWQRSLVHTKPCPCLAVAMASTNGPSLPQLPHLKNGHSSTHPTPQSSACPGVVLLNTGRVPTRFCSFPLPRICSDGDPGSAGSWP